MKAFKTAGTLGRDLCSFASWQTDRATSAGKDRHFPQPVAEVINWDSDPQQQSLLLELWTPVLTCHNVQAVSIRQNDPFQWSLHWSQRVSGFRDELREAASKSEEQREGDILSKAVITGQCSFNHAMGCLVHVARYCGSYSSSHTNIWEFKGFVLKKCKQVQGFSFYGPQYMPFTLQIFKETLICRSKSVYIYKSVEVTRWWAHKYYYCSVKQ